jgi:hypothetical protein
MANPGTIIALTQIALVGACKAVDACKNALHFIQDSNDLVGMLDWQRIRLQIWANSAGLMDDPPSLPEHLQLAQYALQKTLSKIQDLFEDADQIRDRYALSAVTNSLDASPDRVQTPFLRIRRSLRASGVQLVDTATPASQTDGGDDQVEERDGPGIRKRARWGVRDKEQFSSRISQLEARITQLNQLLTETQQLKVKEDSDRVKIIVVSNIVDLNSLELIRSAVGSEPVTSAIVERRAILDDRPWSMRIGPANHSVWNLTDFCLGQAYERSRRVLVRSQKNPGDIYMLEKKEFEQNISFEEKRVLTDRIQRLIMLLGGSKSPSFRTLLAVGYVHDPANFCWWLVFQFPVMMPAQVPLPIQPVSLLALLEPKTKFRPPLEYRYILASRLCTTLWELYTSGWLHKGIRSENIVFQAPSLEEFSNNKELLCSPLVSGFDYSRQESESQSIDKARFCNQITTSIYRHPDYQGNAATGYKIQYDLYSVSLVLIEIGLWAPLRIFVDAKTSNPTTSSQGSRPQLSSDLKQWAIAKCDKELAFWTGSVYYELVRWCLTFADQTPLPGLSKSPVLEFYNIAVAPLARLAIRL